VVNECLYDEKTALRTGQGTAWVTLWWSLSRGLVLPYRSLICALDRTVLPVKNRIQHHTDPFPSLEQCLHSCSQKEASLFGSNMKEGEH